MSEIIIIEKHFSKVEQSIDNVDINEKSTNSL